MRRHSSANLGRWWNNHHHRRPPRNGPQGERIRSVLPSPSSNNPCVPCDGEQPCEPAPCDLRHYRAAPLSEEQDDAPGEILGESAAKVPLVLLLVAVADLSCTQATSSGASTGRTLMMVPRQRRVRDDAEAASRAVHHAAQRRAPKPCTGEEDRHRRPLTPNVFSFVPGLSSPNRRSPAGRSHAPAAGGNRGRRLPGLLRLRLRRLAGGGHIRWGIITERA